MKHTSKILALVLVLMTVLMSLSAITASAAGTKVVNVSDLSAGTTTGDELVAGTGIYASAGMTIDGNKKSIDGFEFTLRLKLPGTMKVDSNYVKIVTTAPAKIIVYAISGSSSDSTRTLQIATIENGAINKLAETSGVDGASIAKYELEVGAAGEYYLGSTKSGINLYYIAVEEVAVCEHDFEGGSCTLCGAADPNACAHTNKTPATCTAPEVCADCNEELSPALGHTEGAAPTCDTAQTCTVCGKELNAALGHTLTFVNTLPTAEAAGKTIADCSVCGEHFDFGEVNVMTGGTYVLDAAKLEGITQNSLFDGEVRIVDGVFACHLSYKYRTDPNAKTFAADDWTSTHRMNFGGKSAFCNNGEGEAAVRNGGLMNFVQIVTTGTTTITFHWNAGGAGREVAVYDMEGNILRQSNDAPEDNKYTAVTTFELPAGTYLLGNVTNTNYWHKVTVEVEAPHVHDYADATCTAPATCACGATEGEALGHEYAEGVCSRCDVADPEYVPEEKPEDKPAEQPVPEMNWFEKLIAMIIDFFKKLFGLA